MENNRQSLSVLERVLVCLVIGAVVLPLMIPLVVAGEKARAIISETATILSVVWIVSLLICSRRRSFIHSTLWKWLPLFYFFRNFNPAYRLIITR
ncbi:MAG: hypothetical protein JWO08_4118 [Verrucomicrobiaceae bacterium]|nr:hypothetical protein [Verrucomicrobiaceae bacterium]